MKQTGFALRISRYVRRQSSVDNQMKTDITNLFGNLVIFKIPDEQEVRSID
jgi:hypothetical protein